MTQKFLYLVNHFVPAPQSDGGIWNVIAENDDECFDLIVEEDQEFYSHYYRNLKENIIKAQRFSLSEEHSSGVMEVFTA